MSVLDKLLAVQGGEGIKGGYGRGISKTKGTREGGVRSPLDHDEVAHYQGDCQADWQETECSGEVLSVGCWSA